MDDLLRLPSSSSSTPFLPFTPIPTPLRRHRHTALRRNPAPLARLAATISPPKPLKDFPFPVPHNEPQLPNSPFREKTLLLRSLGVDLLAAHPSFLAVTVCDIHSTIRLLRSVGIPMPELRRACGMCPEILALGPTALAPVLTFLLREAGVPPANLRRVIHQRPRLLVSDVGSRLRPTLHFLRSLGIDDTAKHADLLSCGVEEKLLPRIEFLKGVGFAPRDARSMARRFPDLFRYSIEGNLEPKFDFFVFEMGRDLKELREFPEYFSFSLEERIKPRHWLCKEKGAVLRLPAMLGLKEREFRARLELCIGSTPPTGDSPLWPKSSECKKK